MARQGRQQVMPSVGLARFRASSQRKREEAGEVRLAWASITSRACPAAVAMPEPDREAKRNRAAVSERVSVRSSGMWWIA